MLSEVIPLRNVRETRNAAELHVSQRECVIGRDKIEFAADDAPLAAPLHGKTEAHPARARHDQIDAEEQAEDVDAVDRPARHDQ